MIDRLLKVAWRWLGLLIVASVAFIILRGGAIGGVDTVTYLIGISLLGYVLVQLGRPIWKARKWWQRRQPRQQRPELPAPAQWVAPRDQRRRNRAVR